MKRQHALQVAELLNQRNKLVRAYTADIIQQRASDFLYKLRRNNVIANWQRLYSVIYQMWAPRRPLLPSVEEMTKQIEKADFD